MIVVDTSVWRSALGDDTSPAREPLQRLIDLDRVVLLSPVRLALLAGVGHERPAVARALRGLPVWSPEDRSWRIVERLAMSAADAGQRFNLDVLLVAALADEHGAPVWSFNQTFVQLADLGLVQVFDGLASDSESRNADH